ncbi:MAG: hypothetical protein ACYTF6_08550, partial [Planctomycetota bacterium]
ARATAAGGKVLGDEVRGRFERVEVKLARSCKVSFQPGTDAPEGFLPDAGQVLDVRADGYGYGWDVNVRRALRSRGKDNSAASTYVEFVGGRTWQICVEDGQYDVTVAVSAPRGGSFVSLNVESVNFCKNLKISSPEPVRITKRVTVNDRKLTLSSDVASPATQLGRIHYLELRRR